MARLRDGESGRIEFTSATVAITAVAGQVGPGLTLARCNYDEPTPCVLSIGTHYTDGTAPGVNGQQAYELGVGDPQMPGLVGVNSGYVEVVYGSGASVQRLVMDLRPGSYQLPPVQQATVTVKPWFNAGTFIVPFSVDGALSVGAVASCSRPTYTVYVPLSANSADETRVPDKARTVDAWVYAVALGAGKPVLSVYDTGLSGFPSLIRDYTNGVWAPPYPAPCFGSGSVLGIISTVTCSAFVQFELDF